jgi:hypothetical protein
MYCISAFSHRLYNQNTVLDILLNMEFVFVSYSTALRIFSNTILYYECIPRMKQENNDAILLALNMQLFEWY